MRTIRLCYRKIIDFQSQKAWDKAVFDDTHLEFYMQAQRMDPSGSFHTFQELTDHVPGAEQLHYLTSTAAIGYIRQLNDLVPDIANAHGKLCLPFKDFKFEIIRSHVTDKSQHKIAIWFYTEPLIWLDTVGTQLLISYHSESFRNEAIMETDLISLVPYLSISHIINNPTHP